MTARRRHYLFAAAGAVLLIVAAALIASSVAASRHRRDVRFGIEELDVLIADGRLAEAQSMVGWLAERATTAGEAMRILRRAMELRDITGSPQPLLEAARRLEREFPGNAVIGEFHSFALISSGRAASALDRLERSGGSSRAELYAWALLALPEQERHGRAMEGDPMVLATLTRESAASQFEKAWRLTGDWRYAVDAVLVLLYEGLGDEALDLGLRAGLDVWSPMLAAEMLIDRGRFDEALELLTRAIDSPLPADPPATAGSPAVAASEARLRRADLLLAMGETEAAKSEYERLRSDSPPPVTALVNLAWLLPAERERLLREAVRLHPESWDAVSAFARHLAAAGADPAPLLESFAGSRHEHQAELLALQLEAELDRRGFAARIWALVERGPSEEVLAWAAWYFASRNLSTDLALLLDRATIEIEPAPSWVAFYAGVADARRGDWSSAAARFVEAFRARPQWESAHNASISLLRSGQPGQARERAADAVLLAAYAVGKRRAAAYILAAGMESDRQRALELVRGALAVSPSDAQALLLRAQLDKPGYR